MVNKTQKLIWSPSSTKEFERLGQVFCATISNKVYLII